MIPLLGSCRQLWLLPLLLLLIQPGSDGTPYGHSRAKRQSTTGCQMADIIFVLDSSGSIGVQHWPQTLDFVKRVVNNFAVGPTATQFGSVTYGNTATIDFFLNTYSNKQDILNRVDRIPYKDENTNTSGALWMMKDIMFKPDKGDRPAAPDICIVVTDGASTYDSQYTMPYANDAKLNGIVMIAIGVGNLVNPAELNGIASTIKGVKQVYTVTSYDTLGVIQGQIAQAACDVHADCLHIADVCFVLDASSNIQDANFQLVKTFLKKILDNLNVADGESNVAMITYADSARLEFNLHQYHGRTDIKAAIDRVPYTKGSSNLADALRMLREQVFTKRDGDRADRTNIAIVFTNRGSNSMADAITQAKMDHLADINILSVGVRSWLNEPELLEVTSDPDVNNAHFIPNFGELNSYANDLHNLLCDGGLFACSTNPCINGGTCVAHINVFYCSCPDGYAGFLCQYQCQPADIAFALDATVVAGPSNFYRSAVNFTKAFATSLNLNPSQTQLALETFSNTPTVQFYLGTYTSRPRAIAAISPLYDAGTTRNTAEALNVITTDIMTRQKGARIGQAGVNQVGVLLTYGGSSDPERTRAMAAAAHAANIKLLVVSVNTRSDATLMELRGIATDPNDANLMVQNSFDDLSSSALLTKLVTSVCNTVNECSSGPCQNGGSCTDGINGYTCHCTTWRTGVNCERTCDNRMDIVIAIDVSGSIRENRFPLVLKYVHSVVNTFDVADDRVKVGVLSFSNAARVRFNLNTYSRKEDVLQAIDVIDYTKGLTNIAEALRTARNQMFTAANGDRSDVPNYLWIFSDGVATMNQDQTIPEAVLTRNARIHIQSVVITPGGPTLDMKNLVTDPWQNNVFTLASYNDLANTIPQKLLCDEVNECDANPCNNGAQCVNGMGRYYCVCVNGYVGTNCNLDCRQSNDIDVVFVIDASGSITDAFDQATRLVRQILLGLDFYNGRTRVGAMVYSDNPRVAFYLSHTPADRQSTLDALAFSLTGGHTNTAGAIETARTTMFNGQNGDRPGVRNLMIVITDGWSNINQQDTIPAAIRSRQDGNVMIAIGVQDMDGINMAEVRSIATPDANGRTFSFQLTDNSQVDNIATSVANIVCQNLF